MDSDSHKSHRFWLILPVLCTLLLAAILYRCYAVYSLGKTDAPTQAAPSEGAIILETVDVSQAPVAVPVHARLLVRACEKDAYDKCHSIQEPPWCENTYKCEIGFLDSENSRLVRLYSFIEEP